MGTRIKTSKHTTKYANFGKREMLRTFLKDYVSAVNFYIDYIWCSRLTWEDKQGTIYVSDIQNEMYDLPKFISTVGNTPDNCELSARALKCASSEAIGIVKSITNKIRKAKFKLDVAIGLGDEKKIEIARKKLNEIKFSKPNPRKTLSANLNSTCCEFIEDDFREFSGFLVLKSIGKKYGKICIPIKNHRHTNRLLKNDWERKTTWLIYSDSVCSTWEKESADPKEEGNKLGLDQGVVTCITLSDGQTTGKDIHGHDLHSVMSKLARKKKGSKAYKKAQTHRENYINWSVKQLNFDGIKEIGFENVRGYIQTTRFLSGWSYTTIEKAIEERCLEEGVLLTKQNSPYRSQRCSQCGFVHKSNRKSKKFKCRECGFEIDADLNGAINHELELIALPDGLFRSGLNRNEGFYWKPTVVITKDGEVLTVPPAIKT